MLRSDLSGDPTLREVLGRAREAALAAYAHQDVPFERVVDVVAPERALNRHPLFQTMVTYQVADDAVGSIDAQAVPVELRTSKFDMSVDFVEARGSEAGVGGSVNYALDLFDPATAARSCGVVTDSSRRAMSGRSTNAVSTCTTRSANRSAVAGSNRSSA